MSKISSSVDESAKSATLLKDSPSRDSRGGQRRRKRLYLERLTFTQVVPDYASFTHEQLAKLISMAPDEQIWRNSFFDSLIHEGLLIELQKLPTEELREFVFMQKEEQGKWRKKLTERKAQREQLHQREPQGQQTQEQDKMLARMHKPHREEFVSMEIRFLPEVRKMVDHLAASKGMAAAECVESILVDTINNNRLLIEEGGDLLKKFRTLPRIKRHSQEEKLARQEERLAQLEALQAGNSTRHR
jgi:hypothetical protein